MSLPLFFFTSIEMRGSKDMVVAVSVDIPVSVDTQPKNGQNGLNTFETPTEGENSTNAVRESLISNICFLNRDTNEDIANYFISNSSKTPFGMDPNYFSELSKVRVPYDIILECPVLGLQMISNQRPYSIPSDTQKEISEIRQTRYRQDQLGRF